MPLLTAQQAFAELGFPSAEALTKAAYRGRIDAHKVGGLWKFDVEAIKRATLQPAGRWDPSMVSRLRRAS